MVESYRPIFSYFDRQLGRPDWESKRVLDFGGNAEHVLMDPSSTIDPRNYCCIDVLESAIREGRRRFSEARWIFYDRFNPGYNPHGQPGLAVPETDGEFDYILAYSVFTHTSWLIPKVDTINSPAMSFDQRIFGEANLLKIHG